MFFHLKLYFSSNIAYINLTVHSLSISCLLSVAISLILVVWNTINYWKKRIFLLSRIIFYIVSKLHYKFSNERTKQISKQTIFLPFWVFIIVFTRKNKYISSKKNQRGKWMLYDSKLRFPFSHADYFVLHIILNLKNSHFR